MSITLLLLVFASIAFPLILKLTKKYYTWPFVIGLSVAYVVISTIGFYTGRAGKTVDIEVLNGEVVDKYSEKVSCEHSYPCNCRSVQSCTGSGSTRSCSSSTVCDTCFDHSYDVDWIVKSNVGKAKIQRVNDQGTKTPPRWSATQVGEPFADTHLHTNYIKGVPESVFHVTDSLIAEKFKTMIPAYPSEVYDYYRINRALTVGVPVPDLQQWSDDISVVLKKLGPQKQANVIVVFVNTEDPSYEYALRSAWLGGKKNDIIVIIGTTQYPTIDWVRVMSWTDREIFKIKLRDELQDLKIIDRNQVMAKIRDLTIAEFKRKSMKDFEYLENEIDPPTWVIGLVLLIMVISSGWLLITDRFNHRWAYRRRRW